MNSSFLMDIALSFYTSLILVKSLFQFGVSNFYRKFFMFFIQLCLAVHFLLISFKSSLSSIVFEKYHFLPLIMGGLALTIQVLQNQGNWTKIQLRVFSRVPLVLGLIILVMFPQHLNTISLIVQGIILFNLVVLSTSSKCSVYQKRAIFKMIFFLLLFFGLKWLSSLETIAKIFLFPTLFYFYLYQHAHGISLLIEEKRQDNANDF